MARAPDDRNRDLGLGSRLAQRSGTRFLNRDGSFNVVRVGLPFVRSLNVYHALITMPWRSFFAVVAAFYLVLNLSFASAYLAAGPGALAGATGIRSAERFSQAFFFSVQTFATIGYGVIHPRLAANLLVTVEALVGLMSLALATGILFARFSRPQARILFSRQAVVAPYRGITGFMFRIANERSSQMIDGEARVSLSRNEIEDGKPMRRFYNLELERSKVNFFPLHWVIVHPIDDQEPAARRRGGGVRRFARRDLGAALGHRRDLLGNGAPPHLVQVRRGGLGRPLPSKRARVSPAST